MSGYEKEIKVSNGYVNSISKGIGGEILLKILEKSPNLNIDWLLEGKGEMLKNNATSKSNLDTNEDKKEISSTEIIDLSTQLGEQKQENCYLNKKIEKLEKENKRLQEELIFIKSEIKREHPTIDLPKKYHTKEKKPYSRA